MRYYAIIIEGAPSVFPARYDTPGGGKAQWGTICNGIHDPNAQQIDFQIILTDVTLPTENSVLTIYGVSWEQIKACNQLVNKPITVYGGMSPGLPLATVQSQRPKQLMIGTVIACWGNWIGNETSIGLAFAPAGTASANAGGNGGGGGGGGSGDSGGGGGGDSAAPQVQMSRYNRTGGRSIDRRPFPVGQVSTSLGDISSILQQVGGQFISDFDIGPATSQIGGMFSSFFGGGNVSPLSEPLNIIHNLMPNIPLSSSIRDTLSKAFPKANLNIQISNGLKLAYQDAGIYQSLEQFAGYINNLSQSILGTKAYPGIHISCADNTIDVWDGSTSLGSNDVSYYELIGQPTWLKVNLVSVKIVLRGGLKIGYELTLPNTVVNFSGPDSVYPGSSVSNDQRTHVSLPGTYKISKILHVGDFRSPDGASWSTNLELWPISTVNSQEAPSQQVEQPNRVIVPDIRIREQ